MNIHIHVLRVDIPAWNPDTDDQKSNRHVKKQIILNLRTRRHDRRLRKHVKKQKRDVQKTDKHVLKQIKRNQKP